MDQSLQPLPHCRMLLLWCVIMGSAGDGIAAGCAFERVAIEARDPPSRAFYAGHGREVELLFSNLRDDGPVEVFPEPPLRVAMPRRHSSCDIDGGIWVRAHIYLSGDERTLLTREYSGSNEQLMFYATGDCRKLAEIDVTDARFSLEPDGIRVRHHATGRRRAAVTVYRFTEQCLPIEVVSKGESK